MIDYLWHHPHGRLAIMMIIIGVLGLMTRLWMPMLLVTAMPSRHELVR